MANRSDVGANRSSSALLRFEDVSKVFKGRKKTATLAVDDVSFELHPARITALVGESGSGKSTVARLITGVEKPTSGTIVFEGRRVESLRGKNLLHYRKSVQMIFQDPFAALNPHNTVLYTIIRPLVNHTGLTASQAHDRALEIMEMVHLTPTGQFAVKRPHQLSGGQRQRLVIARAIAADPKLVVADEPVSMLDISIRADVLRLIADLRARVGMSVLYITHDLISARILADEVLVLYKGHLVERGITREVIRRPRHPYTRLLLESIPNPWRASAAQDDSEATDPMALGDRDPLGSRSNNQGGCPFYDRCSQAQDQCSLDRPQLKGDVSHQTACFDE